MEVTTIIGIVVAIIICLVGLKMILRKPSNAAPSLDSEIHINTDSNQPVIPRHVRHQLQAETADPQRVEPSLAGSNPIDVLGSSKAEPQLSDDIKTDLKKADLESSVETVEKEMSSLSSNDVNAEAVPVTDVAEKTADGVVSTMIAKPESDSDFTLNPNVETADIEAFDEESSILDIHLHEQQRFDDESALANAEYIISLNVYPNPRKALSGDKTLKVLLKYGLRFGEMNCFHRYESTEHESPLMFSVLRITDEGPAGFDLEALSVEQVQGLAFFLALPHQNVQKGYDSMVSIAGLIARETDGTVYDENNLEFTPQLKEHWRHKAIDYRSGQAV